MINIEQQQQQQQYCEQKMQTLRSFRFPENIQSFTSIDSAQDLKRRLKMQRKCSQNYALYSFHLRKGPKQSQAIYLRCTKCKSTINYKFSVEAGRLQLVKFNNQHTHKVKQKSHLKVLQDLLQTFPAQTPLKEMYKIAKEKYQMKTSHFYQSIRKIQRIHLPPEKHMLLYLQRLSCGEYWCYPARLDEKQVPQVALFNFNHSKYSPNDLYLFFHHYYENYYVGILLGLNLNLQAKPHGFFFIKNLTPQTLSSVLQHYANFTHKTQINLIIPCDDHLTQALDLLNRTQNNTTYNYIYEKESMLSNFNFASDVTENVKKMVYLHFENDVDYYLGKFNAEECPPGTIMGTILQQPHKFLISKFKTKQPSSIGILYFATAFRDFERLLDNRLKALRKMLDFKFQTRINYIVSHFKKKIDRIESQEINKIRMSYQSFQDIFNEQQLKELRYKMNKKIFFIFLKHYSIAFKITILKQQEQSAQVSIFGSKYKLHYSEGKWHCQCGFNNRFGIPCAHQIKLIRRNPLPQNQDLIPYFGKQWLIPKEMIIKEKERLRQQQLRSKIGKCKSSRRNKMK